MAAIAGREVFNYTEESFGGPLGQLPLDGGVATTLSTNNGTEGVVSDGTFVYYTSANGNAPVYDGAVLRVPVAGAPSSPSRPATGPTPSPSTRPASTGRAAARASS
jgi:hypothetical protein